MSHRFTTYLALAGALLVAGCDASGKGTLDIHRAQYFYVGGGDPYLTPHTEARNPGPTTYSSEISINADDDNHTAEVMIKIPGCITTYFNQISHYSCAPIGGGYTRCTGDEEDDGTHHGPVRYYVDLKGKDVVRAWIWELKPSSYDVYTERERPDRGPKLVAYFGNHDYPQKWPPRETASNGLSNSGARGVADAIASFNRNQPQPGGEAVHSGSGKGGDGAGAGSSAEPIHAGNASI